MFRLERDQCVARIVIDRGGKRNAIPISAWGQLERLMGEAAAGDSRLIVITSADRESFCAGADLAELPDLIEDKRRRQLFRGAMVSALKKIRTIGKPTLAVIEGGCYGAGVSLAMACDVRVAGPNAEFAITPARFGISYPQDDLNALIKLVGPGQAARLVYTSETIDAEEALRINLVEKIDTGAAVGETMIRQIAGNAAYSLCALKATIIGRAGIDQRFDEAFASDDFSERWKAFKTGRTADLAR